MPASTGGGGHWGGSEGPPVQTTHRPPLHAGGNEGGQGHTPVATETTSSPYVVASDTLTASLPPHKQAPGQRVPVVMRTQSED
jgi:hypothetical protein